MAGNGPPYVLLINGLRRLLGRRWARPVLSSSAGVLLLLLVVRSVPVADLPGHLRPQHVAPLLAVLALVLSAQLIRAVRWRWLLAPLTAVRLRDAFWINAASGFLNYVIPIRAGEAARVVWLSRGHRVAPGTAVGCMVIDHTFDLCGVIAVLGTGALLSATTAAQTPGLPTLLVALGGAVAMLAAIAGSAAFGPRMARSRLVPARIRCRIGEHALAFRAGTRVARAPGRLACLALASAAAVVLDGLAFAMLFRSLGLAVSVISAIVAQVTLLYATVLPAAPGYLGSLEAVGTVVLSHGLGLGAGPAAGAVFLWHAAGAAIIIGVGALALFNLRGQLSPART
jgi:glycosyltransferase 2 family protein